MDDKLPVLSKPKPQGESEQRGAAAGPSSAEPATAGAADSAFCSPASTITRPTTASTCRECLGAMAHRLAQPMTALRGGIELGLMGKRTVADYRALLERTLELADTMVQMIVSLRDLGESGAPGGAPQNLSLEATLAEVVAEIDALAQARGLRLVFNAEGNVKVCADPQRLREAWQSLLSWVIENCAEEGAVVVDLSCAEAEAHVSITPPRLDLQYLQIKILQDLGSPGQLFSHAAKSGVLGWAINHRLWEALGGRLEALTNGLAESTIRIAIPLAATS